VAIDAAVALIMAIGHATSQADAIAGLDGFPHNPLML
jgi:hypothetical protein